MLKFKRAKGFSLIELLIASGISLILLALVISVFSNSAVHSQIDLRRGRLNIMIFDALNRMTTEVYRAGSWNVKAVTGWQTNFDVNITPSGNLISLGSPRSWPVVDSTTQVGPIIGVPSGTHGDGRERLTDYDGSGASAGGENLVAFDTSPTVNLPEGEWFWISPFSYEDDSTNKFQILDDTATRSCILFYL